MKRIIRLSYITLLLVSSGAWAQTANISGLVTDTSGQPVIGASVIDINDRTIGTITDIDGRYTIASVLPNSTLEFSCIGYKTIRETVNGRSTISVILEDDSEFLDEVVVVGYGTVRKKDLTGAVASVSVDGGEPKVGRNTVYDNQRVTVVDRAKSSDLDAYIFAGCPVIDNVYP